MTSDDDGIIPLEEIRMRIKSVVDEERSKNETVNVRPPGYQDLTETLENAIIKAVIRNIHEEKNPEPDVKNIVLHAVRTIMCTINNCIDQDCALMTRKIYKTLDEEGYWDYKEE